MEQAKSSGKSNRADNQKPHQEQQRGRSTERFQNKSPSPYVPPKPTAQYYPQHQANSGDYGQKYSNKPPYVPPYVPQGQNQRPKSPYRAQSNERPSSNKPGYFGPALKEYDGRHWYACEPCQSMHLKEVFCIAYAHFIHNQDVSKN